MKKSWMAWRLPVLAGCLMVLAGCMSQPMMGGGEVPLTNTYWKLQALAGVPTPDSGAASEAHLILRDDGVVNGFSGCNAFRGEYEVINNRNLVFSRMASTRRACQNADIPEPAFFRALENTAGVQMEARYLRLLDTDGQALAEFEAISQP
ncbi:META domain-containing protein [uncultured Marinobacter sp.]|uniref:META domain-containing protein n=1 Tax=uncultured Marinobacter sp. TaxID=187379 RepID=UPI00260542BD|nr:META domain-containing protein [uncultured Marinobacter sp.]